FGGQRADLHEWEIHLNTLFPEVRLKNTLEVRGGDSLPTRYAPALPALWTGILYDERALDEADSLTESFTAAEMEALRPAVAKEGVSAMFRGKRLAAVAERVLTIANGGLARRARRNDDGADETIHLAALSKLIAAGKCPADELLQDLPSETRAMGDELVRRVRL
ncbi:MAG TPA: glutamate-cysteine ligase family protein, partial [Polyangiaceae bacterium]